MAVTPALADDLFAAAPSDGWYNNLLSEPRSPAGAPAKYADWRGLYAGGQVSYSDAHVDFSGSTAGPIAFSLREESIENIAVPPSQWSVLGAANHSAPGFGGFVGYNFEYLTPEMNVVLGFEANFDIASLSIVSPSSPISRVQQDSNGVTDDITIIANGNVSNLEFSTLRGRVGWGIGNFLPYAFVGFALGNANVNATETLVLTQHSSNPLVPLGPFTYTGTAGKDGEWLYGLTAGVGLDIAVSRNFFVRTEYEYVQFQPVSGVNIDVNTVRLGGGVRF
jgi:opacity protein-like surface antigen